MDIYRTPQFEQAVQDFGLAAEVVELEGKIHKCKTYFDVGKLFDGAYPYLKHRQGKFRLIGQVRSVSNKTMQIFVFFRIFERRDKEYEEFLHYKGEARGARLVQQGFNEQSLEDWARAKQVEIRVSNFLPESLMPWTDPLDELVVGKARTEFHIQELDTWTQSVYDNFIEAEEGLRSLCAMLARVLDLDAKNTDVGQINVAGTDPSDQCSIVWAKKSETEIALLHASVLKPDGGVLDAAQKTIDDPEFRSRVKRAYFSIVVFSYELWRDIQKQEGGNIFLSQDEIETLAKMSGLSKSESLPSCLSGRAGSGKTTMLAYVFAAFLWKKARLNLDGTPIYISYNSKLLTSSKELILLLLSANGDFREQIENSDANSRNRLRKIKDDANNYFYTFHDFLLSFIDESELERFLDAKHVDFNDFKRAYLGGRSLLRAFQNIEIRKSISAERAWFIIRQFIKGSLNGNEIRGEGAVIELKANYEELSTKDQQGIEFEEIQQVYKKIFESWYEPNLTDSELWDDQDLVNAAYESTLFNQRPNALFTAIVCDESQDFTPREIRFIVRASELLKYDLDKRQQILLPYLLAGDSLQTLAPTGFRWESVSSILYEEIFASSGIEVKSQKIQLSFNYRSVRPVVDFCNFIQLSRKALFKSTEKEIRHQIAWDNSPAVRPKFFKVNENLTENEFINLLQKSNTFFLIPCEESGEVDFIREDPLLSRIFPTVSESNLPETILSATAAKGLEFTNVCLYNFGFQFEKEKFDFKKSEGNFAFEFFFNKLYVAASRSQKSLTVIESGLAEQSTNAVNFWDNYSSPIDEPNERPKLIDELLQKYPDFNGHIEFLEYGIAGSWNEIYGKVSSKDADTFYNNGKENRDPRLIGRAANLYARLGGEKFLARAQECRALRLEFSGEFEAAGNAFLDFGDIKAAWRIYFSSANLWSRANEISERVTDLDQLEVALVRFMVSNEENYSSILIFLSELANRLSTGKRIATSRPWISGQNEVARRLTKFMADIEFLSQIDDLIEKLEIITSKNFLGLRPFLGQAHFVNKDWSEAIRVWASTKLLDKDYEKNYAIAKARLTGFPNGLRVLSSANLKSEVIEIWREHGSPKESLWLAEVFPAMQNLRLFEDLLRICLNDRYFEKAISAYQELNKADSAAADGYVPSLITECSKNFKFFGDLPMLFDSAKQNGQINIKELCEIVMTNAIKVWDDPQNFGFSQNEMQSYQANLKKVGFEMAQRGAFAKIVNLYQPSRDEKQLDPRWWGLCWELSGELDRATEHYLQYSEAKDKPQIMQYCRIGVIRTLIRNIKFQKEEQGKQSAAQELQRHLENKVKTWSFSDSDRLASLQPKKLGTTVPFFIEPSKSGDFTEDGQFGPFAWKSVNGTIRVEFDETDQVLSWRIDISNQTVVSSGGLLKRDNDGCYRFDTKDWKVEIRFSRNDLKISLKSSVESTPLSKVLRFRIS